MLSWRKSSTVAVAKYSQWPLRVRKRKRLTGVSFVFVILSASCHMLQVTSDIDGGAIGLASQQQVSCIIGGFGTHILKIVFGTPGVPGPGLVNAITGFAQQRRRGAAILRLQADNDFG